jgi:hypothetical protein
MVPGLIATVGINPDIKNWSVQSSLLLSGVIVGGGGERGQGELKTTVKTKAIKTWYKMDLI